MSALKHIALLIPPIRKLHAQRDRLLRDYTAVFFERNRLLLDNHSLTLELDKRRVAELSASRDETRLHERTAALAHRVREFEGQVRRLEDELRRATAVRLAANPLHHDASRRARGADGKAFAIICSAGRTATQWISDAFNLHPRVLFSHGPDLEPRKKTRDDDRRAISQRIIRDINSFDWSEIDAYFDLLQRAGDYLAYGNIHGLVPTPAFVSIGPRMRSYYICALFRHPVSRVQSFVNRWGDSGEPAPSADNEVTVFHEENGDLMHDLAQEFGVRTFDRPTRLFLKSIQTTFFYDSYYAGLGIPVYGAERLVSDTDYFLDLFTEATAGLVDADKGYLQSVRALRPVDSTKGDLDTARAVFSSWEPWQQRFFYQKLEEARLLDVYDLLGYNLRLPLAR